MLEKLGEWSDRLERSLVPSRASPTKYHAMNQGLFEKPRIQDYEASITDAEGVRHVFIIIKTPFHKTKGMVGGVIGIMVDVTVRQSYEEELLKIDKLESLCVLAGGIAHDFNNMILVLQAGCYHNVGRNLVMFLRREYSV